MWGGETPVKEGTPPHAVMLKGGMLLLSHREEASLPLRKGEVRALRYHEIVGGAFPGA